MAKVMVFVDATWLPGALARLAGVAGRSALEIDWTRLPRALAAAARSRLGVGDVEVVRALAFGAVPAGAGGAAAAELLRRLGEQFHYEVEVYAEPAGEAEEECPPPSAAAAASVALGAALLAYAGLPFVYDVAVVLTGDAALAPALRRARAAGKRVVLASVRGACAPALLAPPEGAALADCGILWLDELLPRLEPRLDRDAEEEAPLPPARLRESWVGVEQRRFGGRPRREERPGAAGRRFPGRPPAGRGAGAGGPGPDEAVGGFAGGRIVKLLPEKQIGFLRTATGGDYYFNFAYLDPRLDPAELAEGLEVEGEIYRLPTDRAGAVRGVRRRAAAGGGEPPRELTEG